MKILLTGCSSGIGLSIANAMLEQGYEVVGLSRREPPIKNTAFQWASVDLGTLTSQALESIELPPFEAFIHAAGVMYTGTLQNYDETDAHKMWQLHVAAPALLMTKLVSESPGLKRVILIGSRTQQGAFGKSAYAASKAALQGMVRSWAIELMPRGTTVNLVAPGATKTPMLDDPARAGVAPKLPPMGRFIEPQEIAASVSFLLSENARSITGQTLTVCAGASL